MKYLLALSLMYIKCILFVCFILIEPGFCVYSNKWAVEVEGGPLVAQELAGRHGFVNLGSVGSLRNHYLFEHKRVKKRSVHQSQHKYRLLASDPQVKWVEQQESLRRYPRSFLPKKLKFSDPLWPNMWFLHRNNYTMNVVEAWKRGYTGKGVVITVVDDGLEHNHTDLAANYDPKASYDVIDNDYDPMPDYKDKAKELRNHGTRCAGQIAAVANNKKCVVGVAFQASIGGIRMLQESQTDAQEAHALSYNSDYIDIYCNSWGPNDGGKVVEGPKTLTQTALLKGVTEGRKGKGSIFIWASGNGGGSHDSCGADGYASSMYTISIGGLSERNTKPFFLEKCASTLASAYSGADQAGMQNIVTTDIRNQCGEHTGTSSSAPIAAAMCALALQANPDLTWRDMQYIIVETARTEPLRDAKWTTNGVGKKVSHLYGFGLMDGLRMTQLAEQWITVPERHSCQSAYHEVHVPFRHGIVLNTTTDGCDLTNQVINYLEHVQVIVWLDYEFRGYLQVSLESPAGTQSNLLYYRERDFDRGSFTNWTFMSVFYWGEDPRGVWKLNVTNVGIVIGNGTFYGWQMKWHGTEQNPINIKEPLNVTSNFYDDTYDGEDVEQNFNQSVHFNQTMHKLNLTSQEQLFCHEECVNCTGPSEYNCTTCKHYQVASDGSCVPTCPNTTYIYGSTNICMSCRAPCHECTIQQLPHHLNHNHHPQQQQQQQKTSFLINNQTYDLNNITQLGQYNLGYMAFDDSNKFDVMNGDDNDTVLKCLSCLDEFVLFSNNETSMCLDVCPLGYYADETSVCASCPMQCTECSNINTCAKCANGYDLIMRNQLNECLLQCATNQYRLDDASCSSCDASCGSCTDGSHTSCTLCSPKYLWQEQLCVQNCSAGYYSNNSLDGSTPICKKCHKSCSECVGPTYTECLSCVPPYKKYKSICSSACPPGHFHDMHNQCHMCPSQCRSCHGNRENDCLSCQNQLAFHDGRCIEKCPDSYFNLTYYEKSAKVPLFRCESCHVSCATCSSASSMQCLMCKEGLYFSFGQCVSKCRENEFVKEKKCEKCDVSCMTCSGAKAHHCLQCEIGYFLQRNTIKSTSGQCLRDCPSGYYSSNMECLKCHGHCKTCLEDNPLQCTSCYEHYFLDRHHFCESVNKCPDKQYYNEQSKLCQPCDKKCSKCSSDKECLLCDELFSLDTKYLKCLPPCSPESDNEYDMETCCELTSSGKCLNVTYIQPDKSLDVDDKEEDEEETTTTTTTTTSTATTSTTSTTTTTSTTSTTTTSTATIPMPAAPKTTTSTTTTSTTTTLTTTTSTTTTSTTTTSTTTTSTTTPPTTTTTTSTITLPPTPTSQPVIPIITTMALTSTTSSTPTSTSTTSTTPKPATPTSTTPTSTTSTTSTITPSTTTKPPSNDYIFTILFCILGLLILFAIICVIGFCLFQAKANHKLCWSKRNYSFVHTIYVPERSKKMASINGNYVTNGRMMPSTDV